MPAKTGKQYEWEVAVAAEDGLAKLIQDYDWTDEVLHARIGEIGLYLISKAWNNVYVDFEKWKEKGLTTHKSWWAEIYTEACQHWGILPDANVLAYKENYKESRPDRVKVRNHSS